jgi:hypothetical protein
MVSYHNGKLRISLYFAILFSMSGAMAQQPSPSQLALQINGAVASMAQQMEAQNVRMEQLNQAVATYQKRVKELEDKYERPEKTEAAKP